MAGGLATAWPGYPNLTWSSFATWGSNQQALNSMGAAYAGMTTSQTYYGASGQHIIGATATQFLASKFAASAAANIPFQVWASQTNFMHNVGPDFLSTASATGTRPTTTAMISGAYATSSALYGNPVGLVGAICTYLPALCVGPLVKAASDTDSMDGFFAERANILTALANAKTPIVNSGDSHNFFISSVLSSPATGGTPVTFEFGGGSVTSEGFGDAFGPFGGPTFGGAIDGSPISNAVLNTIEDAFVVGNAATGMTASRSAHGALVFHVTPTTYTGQIFTVTTINATNYTAMCDGAWQIPVNNIGSVTNLGSGTNTFSWLAANSPPGSVHAGVWTTPGCVNTIGGVSPGNLATGTNLGIQLAPSAGTPQTSAVAPSPPPPPPPPSGAYVVSSSAVLTGISAGSFNQAAAAAFKAGIMTALGATTVTITSISATTRRSLLQSSLTVSFLATTTAAGVANYASALAANPSYLAATLTSSGLAVASATLPPAAIAATPTASMGVDVTTTLQPASTSAPQTLTIQHKALSVGLGVGLSVGVGLPLLLTLVYYLFLKPAAGASAPPPETEKVADVPMAEPAAV